MVLKKHTPSLLKDILSEINYPQSVPIPIISNGVNFGEFHANESPQPKNKSKQKSANEPKRGVGVATEPIVIKNHGNIGCHTPCPMGQKFFWQFFAKKVFEG